MVGHHRQSVVRLLLLRRSSSRSSSPSCSPSSCPARRQFLPLQREICPACSGRQGLDRPTDRRIKGEGRERASFWRRGGKAAAEGRRRKQEKAGESRKNVDVHRNFFVASLSVGRSVSFKASYDRKSNLNEIRQAGSSVTDSPTY